jgi:streptogramin lyase
MPLFPILPRRFAAITLLLSAAPALQAQFAVSRGVGRPAMPDRTAASSTTILPERGAWKTPAPQPARRPLPLPFPDAPPDLAGPATFPDRPTDHGGPTTAEGIRRRLVPGANLAGMDLRRLDLAGATLKNASLARADARGANFTRCDLSGVDFTGTRVRGARFFLADIGRTSGLDLTGAELHPFWAVDPDEPIGRVKQLILDDAEGAAPLRYVVSGPDRSLFWLDGKRTSICGVAPTGALRSFEWGTGDTPDQVQALAADGAGRLWVLGRAFVGRVNLNLMGACFGTYHKPLPDFLFPTPVVPSETAFAVARPDGDLTYFSGGCLHSLKPERSGRHDVCGSMFKSMDGVLPLAAAGLPGKDGLAFIDAASNQIVVQVQGRTGRDRLLPLSGGKAAGLALGPDGSLWCTMINQDSSRPDVILRIPLASGEGLFHPLPAVPGGGPRGLGAIAAGPDDHLWFVEADAGRIGRISLAGDLTYFPLPAGTRPRQIFPSHDGRMFFTEDAGGRLGSIRVLARPAETVVQHSSPSEVKASWQVAPYTPRLQPKARKVAHRQAEPLPDPAAGMDAKQPIPASGTGLETKHSGPAPAPSLASPPDPRPRATPPGLSPHARLAALGIILPYGSLGHILTEHGHSYASRKGAFAPEFSSIIALEKLLADSLEGSGGLAAVWRTDGRSQTLCVRPGVGRWRSPDGTQSGGADRFLVVADSTLEDDGTRTHRIVTAYPVR